MSLTRPIYGSVVSTLYSLHAKVIDSCIDIIVVNLSSENISRSQISSYFDETMSSKPYLSQSVTPVTPSLAKESSVCAQPYVTYTPFVAQGMTTLFSR